MSKAQGKNSQAPVHRDNAGMLGGKQLIADSKKDYRKEAISQSP